MKKLTLLLASLFGLVSVSMAHGYGRTSINSYADAFVFDEMGVTFSVYPDGEFDFYLAGAHQATTISNGYVSATFNSGYDYNPYVQYDDFGAVIQVENVPVWYDHYGRVSQIGDVLLSYRNRRIYQVGGLYVHYNSHGHYDYHTGYINRWNPYFVYRPFYVAFARPVVNLCFVRTTPYRQYYTPVRYTYYRPYVTNVRPRYATIGHTYRPSGGYGVAHRSYRQSAGRGEVAFKRERQLVTTASARQQSMNLRNANATQSSQRPTNIASNASMNLRANEGRSAAVQQAPTTRTSTAPRSAAGATRTMQQSTTQRQAPSTPTRTTAVRTAPTRSSANTVNSSARRTSTSTQLRSTASPNTHAQPRTSSTSTRTAPSRSSVTTAPSRNSTAVRTQPTQRVAKPQTSTRATSAKPAVSNQGRVSGAASRGSSSVKTSAPERSTSSRRRN